jgi:hypothetical protein
VRDIVIVSEIYMFGKKWGRKIIDTGGLEMTNLRGERVAQWLRETAFFYERTSEVRGMFYREV